MCYRPTLLLLGQFLYHLSICRSNFISQLFFFLLFYFLLHIFYFLRTLCYYYLVNHSEDWFLPKRRHSVQYTQAALESFSLSETSSLASSFFCSATKKKQKQSEWPTTQTNHLVKTTVLSLLLHWLAQLAQAWNEWTGWSLECLSLCATIQARKTLTLRCTFPEREPQLDLIFSERL